MVQRQHHSQQGFGEMIALQCAGRRDRTPALRLSWQDMIKSGSWLGLERLLRGKLNLVVRRAAEYWYRQVSIHEVDRHRTIRQSTVVSCWHLLSAGICLGSEVLLSFLFLMPCRHVFAPPLKMETRRRRCENAIRYAILARKRER